MENKEHSIVPLDVLRSRITKLTSRIIFRLEDRSSFPLNPYVYQPGAVPLPDNSNLSFLESAIKGLEEYHGTLGRWESHDQHPLIISAKPATIGRSTVGGLPELPNIDINLKDKLLPFYTGTVLPQLCDPKDNPDTYGETVYLDADVLELLNERINLGRYVAASKVETDPKIWDIVSNREALINVLRDSEREKIVISGAIEIASRHGLDASLTASLFRWVIDRTMDVEVDYLQGIPRPNIE
ncbi:MAG: hypothetical protein Q8Q65_04660 [bacterium]|nr:hypothetical protein [bacterium]